MSTLMEKGATLHVLDAGFVTYVDHMGTDADIVEAARISTGRGFVSWNEYARCKRCNVIHSIASFTGVCGHEDCASTEFTLFPRGDLGILEYMMVNGHTTPFEMCALKLHVKCPMDVWRQWIRQRTASVNEYSTRYSEAIDDTAKTAPDAWRVQGVSNRQGSGSTLLPEIGRILSTAEAEFQVKARRLYEQRLEFGVAKEQARKDLPLSTYTEAYWKIDLHNCLKFLGQRLNPHAQFEIRQYAEAVATIVASIWPRTYELFEEHVRNAVRLSATERALLWRVLEASGGHLGGELQEAAAKFMAKVHR